MKTLFTAGALVISYILGTTLLHLSLRIIGKAHGHMVRSAAVYLAMLLGGGCIGGVIFYAATEIISLRPVIAFTFSFACASLCQWVIGFALFRRIVLHSGFAIAIPVLLLFLLGCASAIPVIARIEQQARQARQLFELRVLWREIVSQLYENETMNIAVPTSLSAILPEDAFLRMFGNYSFSDLEYLPEWLARSGMLTNSYKFQDVDKEFPLLWLKTKKGSGVPVVDCNGGSMIIDHSELEKRLKMAAEGLKRTLSPLPERVWRNTYGDVIATGSFHSIGPVLEFGGGIYVRLSPGYQHVSVDGLSLQDMEYLRSLGVLPNAAVQ